MSGMSGKLTVEDMKKNQEKLIAVAILAMSVVQMGMNAVTPVLSDIRAQFPKLGTADIQLLAAFPSFFVIVCSCLAAKAARWIPKKYIAAAGCMLVAFSGIWSWRLYDRLICLWVGEALLGSGIGMVVPMAASLVTDCFDKDCHKMMGWQTGAAQIGAMVMTFLGGILAQICWNQIYLIYLLAVPGCILSLVCIPRSCSADQSYSEQERNAGRRVEKVSFLMFLKSRQVRKACLYAFGVTFFYSSFITNISILASERSLNTGAAAGVAVSLVMLSGACGGLWFGKIVKRVRLNIVFLGFLMLSVGQLTCSLTSARCITYFGCLVGGLSISLVMPQVILHASEPFAVGSEYTASLCMAASNLGALFAPVHTVIIQYITGTDVAAVRLEMGAVFAFLIAFFTPH